MQVFSWKSDKHYFYTITLSYKKYVAKICLCQKKAVILQANDSVSDYVFDSKYISQSGCLGKRFLL